MQAVLAREQSDAARRREPADADPAVVARPDRPAVRHEGLRHLLPGGSGADAHSAGLRVEDLDRIHGADVDDEAAAVGRTTADAVPCAAHAEWHVAVLP